MYINSQVGPDVVYILEVITFNDPFKDDLYPCRNTHYDPYIPAGSKFYDLFQLGFPVAFDQLRLRAGEPAGILPAEIPDRSPS